MLILSKHYDENALNFIVVTDKCLQIGQSSNPRENYRQVSHFFFFWRRVNKCATTLDAWNKYPVSYNIIIYKMQLDLEWFV